MVDLLLQYYANVSAVDPVSGHTALTAFVRNGRGVEIAAKLLEHGADPSTPDRTRKSAAALVDGHLASAAAREDAEKTARHKALAELFAKYRAEGPEGFEDPPGVWQQHAHTAAGAPADAAFFHNAETGAQRFSRPTSLTWTRVQRNATSNAIGGERFLARVFVNQVTGQTLLRVPRALRWRFIRTPTGDEFWLSVTNNATSASQPPELPADMAGELRSYPNAFWTNGVLGRNQWEEPVLDGWHVASDARGRAYYVHEATGQTSWTRPAEFAWMSVSDGDERWYANEYTGEKTWREPAAVAWRLVDESHAELARFRPCPSLTPEQARAGAAAYATKAAQRSSSLGEL